MGEGAVLAFFADRAAAGSADVVEGFVLGKEGGVAGEELIPPRAGGTEERHVDRPGAEGDAGIGLDLGGAGQDAEQRVGAIAVRQAVRAQADAGAEVLMLFDRP